MPAVTSQHGITLTLNPPIKFILRQHGRFRRELSDLSPLWERFKTAMSEIERSRFESHGHGQWPPLAESTLREKARLGYPADPLVRTGALMASLVDPGRAARTSRTQMIWESIIPYSIHHQEPSVAGRPPQRKVLDIRVDDRRTLERQLVSFINEASARAFGRG